MEVLVFLSFDIILDSNPIKISSGVSSRDLSCSKVNPTPGVTTAANIKSDLILDNHILSDSF